MNHQEYIENVDPYTPVLKPKQAPNLMCIPEIELPPPQINPKASHFRNNSNPQQDDAMDLELIQNDFAPLSHQKTDHQLKLSTPPYPSYNDSYINFNTIETSLAQFQKHFIIEQQQDNSKEFGGHQQQELYSKSFQILNFAQNQLINCRNQQKQDLAKSAQELDWTLK